MSIRILLTENIKYAIKHRIFISRELQLVTNLYQMSSDELWNYKNSRFLNIFTLASRCSEFYKAKLRAEQVDTGDIKSLEDIKNLPVLTKADVKGAGPDLLTSQWRFRLSTSTSGSTGAPLTLWYDYSTIRMEQAYMYVRRLHFGFRYGDKLVSVRGVLPHNCLSRFIVTSNTLHLSSYRINADTAAHYHEIIASFNADFIEGYPSSLHLLATLFKELGVKLSCRAVITASETLFDHQRQTIAEVFNCEVYDGYGLTERSVSLVQLPSHTGYVEEPGYGHVEYDDDGLLTTGFINSLHPLIRYKVDDVVERDAAGIVQKIAGRAEDYVVCKDGTRVGRLDHIFKGVSNVQASQVVQHGPGAVIIKVIPEKDFGKSDELDILRKLRGRVAADNLDVTIERVSHSGLIRKGRDKIPFVVSAARQI